MPAYTSVLQKPLETIFWEDDNFMEELLQVVRLFRPFSAAITEFISEHGYQGDTSDIDAKVAFIRAAFAMDAPREVREWFTLQQPIKRDTVFQICFAFGLDGGETDEFFRRIFTRERSFNCHQMPEAIYYFCLNNGLTWTDAMDIQSSVSLAGKEKTNGDIVYTGSIIAELNNLQDKDDLIHWLNDNIDKFAVSNVTAYETIRRLWEEVSGPDGLLIQERKSLPSIHDDAATGEKSKLRSNVSGVRSYDAYLAILQLDNETEEVSDDITLNTAVPVVTITGPDKTKISKVEGFNKSKITFTCDVDFAEYKVCVVPQTSSTQDAGTVIPTTAGSINTSGSDGSYPKTTPIEVTITGTDLETASSGDSVKIVKVFVKTAAGIWSVA